MQQFVRSLSVIIVFVYFLTSCAIFQTSKEQDREARCKELNHQIIFNGATPSQTVAMQQRAEMDTLNKDYRADGCS